MKRIDIKGLNKEFGDVKALQDITMTIQPNKIYGLLGRNGAGKTTLLNILTNRIFPTSGEVTIDGNTVFENDEVLNNIFYLTEKNLYPIGEKIKNIFKWTRKFYPLFDIKYAHDLSEKFGLDTNKKVKDLSTGYSSIFKGIVALASNAKIILLDEPILGLDAYHRDIFYKELIANYNAKPKTIVISTHLIGEVAQILEEAIIIKEGKIITKQSVQDLLSSSYIISGEISKVDQYIKGKDHIEEELMGSFKSVIVLEKIINEEKELAHQLDLEFSKIELQELFISLTN
ncbi:MAG: ABC transporter ATP-binding protein [Eubacteriaceae bacterium]